MSVNAKMTAIADEIRELSGTSGAMGLDEMASRVGEANTDVATETDLIAQIQSALEGKSAGDVGGSAEACVVTIMSAVGESDCQDGENIIIYVDETLNTVVDSFPLQSGLGWLLEPIEQKIMVAKGTFMYIPYGLNVTDGEADRLVDSNGYAAIALIHGDAVLSV